MRNNGVAFKRMKFIFGVISFFFVVSILTVLLVHKDTEMLTPVFLIYLGVCAVFIPILAVLGFVKTSRMEQLKKNCRIVQAEVVAIENISDSKYVAKCRYRNDQKTYIFYSETLTSNPKENMRTDTVLVYVDKQNPENYYVDMTSAYRN